MSDERDITRELESWLAAPGPSLDEHQLHQTIDRLTFVPQRRRWWPLRWFPFGFGATRDAGSTGPYVEGRTKLMFNATHSLIAVAIVALVGGSAFLVMPSNDVDLAPAGASQAIDADDFGGFTGTMRCVGGTNGDVTLLEWGSLTVGESYPRCTIEATDSRISGNGSSVHDYYRYDGEPTWGVRSLGTTITNDDGTWISTDHWGYQQPADGTMFYAGQYRGTDAYEGLSALFVMSQDKWGLSFDIEGVIFPGELPEAPEPPVEAASPETGLATD